MSKQQVAALVERLQADEDLAAAIRTAQTQAAAARIATAAGIAVTADEIAALAGGANEEVS